MPRFIWQAFWEWSFPEAPQHPDSGSEGTPKCLGLIDKQHFQGTPKYAENFSVLHKSSRHMFRADFLDTPAGCDGQSFHQPSELLWCQGLYLRS